MAKVLLKTCYYINTLKGTPLRSDRVTHQKKIIRNPFLLLTCVGHSSQSCGTLICFLSVGNSLKTCIISVDLGKALVTLFPVQQVHSNFKLSCQIDKGHIKVQSNPFIVVTQGTEPKLTTIDRWPLYPGLVHFLFVWPRCVCMIDIYRCYESCSSQNVLHLMHKYGRNKLVTAFRLFYVVKSTGSSILDFNLWPFSFHRLKIFDLFHFIDLTTDRAKSIYMLLITQPLVK